MKVGGIVVADGIDYWGLAQEFIDNQKEDQFGLPTETRVILFRETHIELYINPRKDFATTDEINVSQLRRDMKDR